MLPPRHRAIVTLHSTSDKRTAETGKSKSIDDTPVMILRNPGALTVQSWFARHVPSEQNGLRRRMRNSDHHSLSTIEHNFMDDTTTQSVRESYDRIADEYALRIFNELQHKPLDRELLDRFAAEVAGSGAVCDMGCGPGHVARYLRDAGISVFGLDLSPQMIEEARRLNPDISFQEENMMRLSLEDSALAGITAFYAIVNIPKESLPLVFREMERVLQPGGLLLLGFHTGDEGLQEKELWGRPISLNFFLFQPLVIRQYLEAAGLGIEEIIERGPYAPEVEYQSRRAYIFARKPDSLTQQ